VGHLELQEHRVKMVRYLVLLVLLEVVEVRAHLEHPVKAVHLEVRVHLEKMVHYLEVVGQVEQVAE